MKNLFLNYLFKLYSDERFLILNVKIMFLIVVSLIVYDNNLISLLIEFINEKMEKV